MKTYAESKKRPPFDWNRFLKNAIRRKTDLPDEVFHEVCTLSADWVTCACGNQCEVIPRNSIGCPLDPILAELGSDFADYISDSLWQDAKRCLKQIENRTVKLLDPQVAAAIRLVKELYGDSDMIVDDLPDIKVSKF